MTDAAKAVGMMLVAFLISAGLALASWAWKTHTAEIRGKANAEVQIESADSRISNYEHFFDLCASVQGYEQALVAQRSALAAGVNADRTHANLAGISAQRARAIAQYNADASKSYTRARFLGSELPRRLDINQENTQCN